MLSFSLIAQEYNSMKSSIGITSSFVGSNVVTNTARETLLGGPSYNGKSYFALGLSYIHPVRFWLDIESGIEFSNYIIIVKPMSLPNMEFSPYHKYVNLMNIPLTIRVNFLKYFFINGGFMIEYDLSNASPIESQSGVGTLFGIGVKYKLKNGLGAFINGYYKSHSLIPFPPESDDYRWRLIEGGWRMGITYDFQ